MLPFDSRTPNLLKISSDIESDFRNSFFGTLHTDLKVELNFYDHCLQSCTKMHLMLPSGPEMHDSAPQYGKIVQSGLKAWSRLSRRHVLPMEAEGRLMVWRGCIIEAQW